MKYFTKFTRIVQVAIIQNKLIMQEKIHNKFKNKS